MQSVELHVSSVSRNGSYDFVSVCDVTLLKQSVFVDRRLLFVLVIGENFVARQVCVAIIC